MSRPNHRWSFGIIVTFLLALASGVARPPVVQAVGTNYYVNNTVGSGCSDAGLGTTTTTPWCSFALINDPLFQFQPGDHLWLSRGAAWNTATTPLILKGTNTSPAVIVDAYGTGTRPRLYGTGKENERGIRLLNQSYWTIRNLELDHLGIGILARYTTNGNPLGGPHTGVTFDQLYLHDMAGIYHRSGSGLADDAFNSAGIVLTSLPPFMNGTPAVTNILFSNIEGTHNQNSILIEGGGITPGSGYSQEEDKTIDGVTLRNLYLHDDDAGQPTSPRPRFGWEFETAGNVEGWYGSGPTPAPLMTASVPVTGKLRLSIPTNQSAPYLHSPTGLGIDPTIYRYLRIKLSNPTNSAWAFLYFRRSADSYFVGTNYVAIPINPSSGLTEYQVDLASNAAWGATSTAIDQFRLDLRNSTPAPSGPQVIEVDFLRIERVGWEFNSPGSLEGWGNPYPTPATTASQSTSTGEGALHSQTTVVTASLDSPTGLNINPNDYRYLRIGLRNRTSATTASIFFQQGGTYYAVTWPIYNTANPDQYYEYMVDMGTNANWAPTAGARINHFRLTIPAGGTGIDINYLRIERRGCDESLKIVAAKHVTLSDSRLIQAAACDSLTGTASLFVGNVTDFRIVNTMIKDTPAFPLNRDMDGIDFEAYNKRMIVQNGYFAGNKGPGINIITRTGTGCDQTIPDYAKDFTISGNLFVNNGTGATPTAAAIRDVACNPAASVRATGSIKQNLYAETGGLLTSPSPSQLVVGMAGSLDQNLSVPNGSIYAADSFSGTQGGGGWSYRARSTATGTLYNLTYDSATESWGPNAAITRFNMRPELNAGAEVVWGWTVPASANGHFVSIRSHPMLILPLDATKQTVAVRVTRTPAGGSTEYLLSPTTLATTGTSELDQLAEITVATGDVINFVVANTSSTPTLVPTVSWAPAIGIR